MFSPVICYPLKMLFKLNTELQVHIMYKARHSLNMVQQSKQSDHTQSVDITDLWLSTSELDISVMFGCHTVYSAIKSHM